MLTPSSAGGRAELAANVARFRRVEAPAGGLKAASVAACVVLADDVPSLLITRRAAGLRNHAGQWALPGAAFPVNGPAPIRCMQVPLHRPGSLRAGVDSGRGPASHGQRVGTVRRRDSQEDKTCKGRATEPPRNQGSRRQNKQGQNES